MQCDRSTVAPSSTRQADSVVSGPITQPEPITVPASSEVPGKSWVSGPIRTSAWIQVVAGSVTVTPASWACRTSRALSWRLSSAS